MPNYRKILEKNYPERKWTAGDNSTYEQIDWVDEMPKPSKQELDELNEDWTLIDAKKDKIDRLNSMLSGKIYSNYSQQKQMNLIDQALSKKLENDPTIDPEYKEMKEFIDPLRTKRDEIRAQIEAAESCEDLEEIEINLEVEE